MYASRKEYRRIFSSPLEALNHAIYEMEQEDRQLEESSKNAYRKRTLSMRVSELKNLGSRVGSMLYTIPPGFEECDVSGNSMLEMFGGIPGKLYHFSASLSSEDWYHEALLLAKDILIIKRLHTYAQDYLPSYIEEMKSWDRITIQKELGRRKGELKLFPQSAPVTEEAREPAIDSLYYENHRLMQEVIAEIERLLLETSPSAEKVSPLEKKLRESKDKIHTKAEARNRFAELIKEFPQEERMIERELRLFLDQLEDE